jgi:multisubunit Na+/H+ antiporter MnhB subunit
MSADVAERRWWLAVRMAGAAMVWSLGLLLAALLVPTYDVESSSPDAGVTLTQVTLIQGNGAWALVLVAVPVIASVLVAVAMVFRRREDPRWASPAAWSAIGVLALVALLGITSVGAFMLPVAALLALSVRLAPGWGDVRAHPARA